MSLRRRQVSPSVELGAARLCEFAAVRFTQAQQDAETACLVSVGLVEYAMTGRGVVPNEEVLAAVARATGATSGGSDVASSIIRAATARMKAAKGRPVPCGELAAVLGVSRQYAWRTWKSLVKPADAATIIAEHDAKGRSSESGTHLRLVKGERS